MFARPLVLAGALALAGGLLGGCAPRPAVVADVPAVPAVAPADSVVTVTLVQLNDVYEITPIEGGRVGGLARVGGLLRRLEAENPHTYAVMAGDFFSPSALGTARVDGQRLNGQQMVAVLNVMGLDLATFGNHEFDIPEADFLARLGESRFRYVSGNVTDAAGGPFPNTDRHHVLRVPSPYGPVRVAFVGVTLGSNPKPYVRYGDPLATLRAQAAALADSADALVALTHLAIDDDVAAAVDVPGLDLLLGGHEHENILVRRGGDLTPLAKADANARTVFVHHLRLHPRRGLLGIDHELVPVTDATPEDAATAAEVARWVERGFAGFREAGFEPEAVVTTTPEALDGREASVRTTETALTALIAEAYFREAEAHGGVDLALYNGGSIRVDDVLPPGPLTQYDVIRVLPFGGNVLTVELPGALLDSVLTQGVANRGSGGYLHHHGVTRADDGAWQVHGRPIDPAYTYRVGITDFLVTGLETGLAYLNAETNPRVRIDATHGDVRQAVIDELRRRYGTP